MNSDLRPDDDRQNVSITTTPPINSKSDVRQPILEIRQHDRKKMPTKLKVMMTDKVNMIVEKEKETFHPLI